jgi:hypothetical protein
MTHAMTFQERASGLTNRIVLVAIVPTLLAYVAFTSYGEDGRGLAAGAALYVTIGALRFFWDLRSRGWFRIAMSVLTALQAVIVLAGPWSNGPYRVPILLILFPLGLLDFTVIYWCVRLGERVFATPPSSPAT